jgi:RimJ/RimL family protein N-acetyltransferase
MVLRTERLILRQWRDEDFAPFARLNDDPAVMEFMPRRLNRDESDAFAARIRTDIERRGWGLWAVEVSSSARGEHEGGAEAGVLPPAEVAAPFIGYVGLSVPSFDAHFTPCVEVGWRLAREHWGHGYAGEAAAACLRFGFQTLSLKQIVSFTAALNRRSTRVMERIGMTRDAAGDFEHPKLAPGHPLRAHVLYRINRT